MIKMNVLGLRRHVTRWCCATTPWVTTHVVLALQVIQAAGIHYAQISMSARPMWRHAILWFGVKTQWDLSIVALALVATLAPEVADART
jgi:hypothetical protein